MCSYCKNLKVKFVDLLQPLLSDVCLQIQQCAAIAIGRLVHHDSRVAKQVLNRDFLPLLLRGMDKQNVRKTIILVKRLISLI